MSTAFGIKSNCLVKPNNEFRYWGKKVFEVRAIWNALLLFAPQIMDFFSIPNTDRGVSKFFTKLFRDNVEYRQTHHVVRHDFMNLLIQLMEKGYVEPDDDSKDIIDENCKYIFYFHFYNNDIVDNLLCADFCTCSNESGECTFLPDSQTEQISAVDPVNSLLAEIQQILLAEYDDRLSIETEQDLSF